MYVFEWVPVIIHAYVLEAGRRDEAEVGGEGRGVGQGMIVQEREASLNRGSQMRSPAGGRRVYGKSALVGTKND